MFTALYIVIGDLVIKCTELGCANMFGLTHINLEIWAVYSLVELIFEIPYVVKIYKGKKEIK